MAVGSDARGRVTPGGVDVQLLLQSPVRRQIVDLLANPATGDQATGSLPVLTAAELAERLGLHVTTVRFHLDQLVAGRVLDSEFRAGKVGRPRKLYRFRPGVAAKASPAGAFQALAEVLAEGWGAGENGLPLTAEEAGRRWAHQHVEHGSDDTPATSAGAWLGKVGRVVDLLADWGYAPELSTANQGHTAELVLSDCPFLALAEHRPEVVCAVHRGLLRGAFDAVGETRTKVHLRPFVAPGQCTATLTQQADFGAAQPPPERDAEEEARG